MRNILAFSLLISGSIFFYSCNTTSSEKAENKSDSTAVHANADNKYSASLREACEKLSKAELDGDTATRESLLDPNFSVTMRAKTFLSRADARAYAKTQMSANAYDTGVKDTRTYKIEMVEAGSHEPVWAGYDRGTFENESKSADGKYNRKVTGPYYRSWKLVNGQWKCYHLVVMAFTCEGNDCAPKD